MGVEFEGCTMSITASLGVAEAVPGEDGRKIVSRADECVYASKCAGRNCCHWHNGARCVLAEERQHQLPSRSRVSFGRPLPAISGVSNQPPFIPDRAVLISLLQRRVAESARSGEPLSVLQIAITERNPRRERLGADRAAQVGHVAVSAISSSLRDMDYLGRWSDAEFTVILPRCTNPAARIVAQRMLAVVTSALNTAAMSGVAAAIGIATIQHPMTAEQLIAEARRQVVSAEVPA